MRRRTFIAGGAAAALGGCVSGGGGAEGPEAKYPPLGQFTEAEGLRVHYVDKGAGPTIILVHGANGNLRDFTFSMVDRLADRHRVIAFDRPGHGYTDRPAQDGDKPAVQARILSAAAARLGVERAVIVGHSFGGAVAAAWALDQPGQAAAMASLAGAVYPWGGDGGTLYAMANSGLSGLLGAAARTYVSGSRLESLVGDVFAPNPPTPGYAQYVGVELALRPDTFRYNGEDVDRLNDNLIPQSARYGELAMPIEILHGGSDETVGYEVHSIPLWKAAQNANITLLPGVGHMPHHVREDEVVAALERLAVAV